MGSDHFHGVGCEFRRPFRISARPDGYVFVQSIGDSFWQVPLGSNPGKLERLGSWPGRSLSRFMTLSSSGDWLEATIQSSNQIKIKSGRSSIVLELKERVLSYSYWQPSRVFSVLCGESRQQIVSFKLRSQGQNFFAEMVEGRELPELGLSEIASDSDGSFVALSSESGEFWSLPSNVSERRVIFGPGRAENGGIRAARSLVSNGTGAWAFVDRDNYRLIWKGNTGEIHTLGKKGSEDYEFDWPNDLCFIGPSTVLVADTNNDRISSLNLETSEFGVAFSRNTCPDLLCRPVSIDLSPRGVLIVDRDNDRILEISPNGGTQSRQLRLERGEKVNAAIVLSDNGKHRKYVLGRSPEGGFLREVSLVDMETINEFEGGLFDPQGMTKFLGNSIVLSDTLNRRGLILDPMLKHQREIDLALVSGLPRFLCRTPSVVRSSVIFVDYESGVAVTSGLTGNGQRILGFDLEKLGFSSLRRIVEWGDMFVLFGRGNGGLAFLDRRFSMLVPPYPVVAKLASFQAPVDGVPLDPDTLILVDKERDSVFAITAALFQDSLLSDKVVVQGDASYL